MTTTLLASTADSTGKTAVALALARAAQDRERSVGYMKPLGTHLQSNVGKTLDPDPLLARDVLGLDTEVHEMEPVVYSPTFVDGVLRGKENADELRERVRTAYDGISASADDVFVEAAGTPSTGRAAGLAPPALADLLDARVVLVSDYGESRDVDGVLDAADRYGDRLAGVLFNRVTDAALDDLDADAAAFLESRDVPVLGALPRVPELAGVTVADLADELGARTLGDADTDGLVERFLVGAMSGESALRHFRRSTNAAVVTGGDRADVQTAALDAPGVECLVLTGGHEPSGAVLGKAADAGVPVLVVNTDTLRTVERLEAVLGGGHVRNEDTVARMSGLLAEHADLDALLG
ncbi:phosphotransacetylase family protein [Salarchaeum sp. III]|uniref:phosphotransacetylase family protein n=1 Tax=Salarchaeum sp. III TaxID=3107927 RepID=UPI002EDBA258